MLQDIFGSLLALLGFATVLYAPGYLFGLLSDCFGFRRISFATQSVWAITSSFCIAPIAGYLAGRLFGLRGVTTIFAACAVFAMACLLLQQRGLRWFTNGLRWPLLVAVGWTALCLLLLIDFQVGHKLFFSVVMADQSYRISFTDAVVRTGIPPANPLYTPGTAAPMHYYYFWYVLCATVVRLIHVSPRQAFIASSIWAGFGLIATTYLFSKHFFHWNRRGRWLAMGLLLISGADLLPAVGQALLQPSLNGDTEWWSVDPVDSWPDSLLWVPHHVAAALCCLLTLLLLWTLRTERGTRQRIWLVLLAGAALGSAVGLSVYVAFGFALITTAFLLWFSLRRFSGAARLWTDTLLAGAVGLLLALPFFFELLGSLHPLAASSSSPSPHLFTFSVRRMIDSGLLTGLPALARRNVAHPVLLDQAIRTLLLVPGLAMELGAYGAVLVLLLLSWHRGRLTSASPEQQTALFWTCAGLLLTLFVSSAVITNNDFGYRAVMLPQFFLMLLTAEVLSQWQSGQSAQLVTYTAARGRLVYGLLAVGALGMVYWAILLRGWLPFETARPKLGFTPLPEDAYQIRQAFAALDRVAPPGAVITFRPIDPTPDRNGEVMAPNEYYQRMLVMDAGHALLNAEEKCAVHFGGDPAPCHAIQSGTRLLYAVPAPDADIARNFCRHFGVSYLVLSAWDPQWKERSGWTASLPVVAAQDRIRIFQCR